MPDHLPNHEKIPQPVRDEPEALVEHVFALPLTEDVPDYCSQDQMGEYLYDRLQSEETSTTRIAFEATGRTLPGIRRVSNGHKEMTRWRATKEWLISPRTAATIWLGSAILLNALGNHETLEGEAKLVGHEVYRLFDPVQDVVQVVDHPVTTPGKVVDLQIHAGIASTDVSGGTISINRGEVRSLAQQVNQLKAQGGNVLSVTVTGETSNDWGAKGDAAFGVPNVENEQLGKDIARKAFDDVKPDLSTAGLDITATTFTEQESILTPSEKDRLINAAKTNGYNSLESAVKAVDRGELKQGNLYQSIRDSVTSKRGESLDVKVALPGKSSTTMTREIHVTPGVDDAPQVPKPKFFGFIPMIPLRRFERFKTMKQKTRLEFVPSIEIMRPRIIREDVDQAWLRVRPEAVKTDGTLVDNAWAFTRKYEHLMRDDRIAEVLRADFKNTDDSEKSLRIMFVDETPADETVQIFSDLLTKFTSMDGGKISGRVSAIFVYPSEHAGTSHGDPKRIAMGVDQQSESEVMGTYTYILDLVELHMPSKLNPPELEALLSAFDGPAWTLAHEVAGHGTDDNDSALRLRRVITSGILNAHVVDGDPRALKMKPLDSILRKLPLNARGKKYPIKFDVAYPVLDKTGQIVTMNATVYEGDPRLAHATHATIVGSQPTRYAGTNQSEHYAETAAATTTGIGIPFIEASIAVDTLRADNGNAAVFTQSYRPDERGQRLFVESVGGVIGTNPVGFDRPASVTITRIMPEDDSLIRAEMIRTRRITTLAPSEMVAILARATRRKKRA